MADQRGLAPVIIKRKKIVASDGHHGGAWKVAYADFVTAMMAFFMLMWLLNATTETQRKGIADYFNPTIPVNRISGGGDGVFGGQSVFSEDALPQSGTGGTDTSPTLERQSRGTTGIDVSESEEPEKSESETLKDLEKELLAAGGESSMADNLLEHVHTRLTDEGLIVEIFDLPGEPLFSGPDDQPTEIMQALITMIANVFEATQNKISVNGFSRAFPIVQRVDPTWDRTTARAQTTRRMLEDTALDKARIARVTGWADRKPAHQDPMAVRNNRLEIILLRSDRAGRP